MQILFQEKACKKHISSCFLFQGRWSGTYSFSFYRVALYCWKWAAYGWSWKCKRTSFLNSWVLPGRLRAIWVSGGEALNELFCFAPKTFELIVKFPWTEKPTFALIWYLRGAIPGALWGTYAPAAVTLFWLSPPLVPHIHSPAGACPGGSSDPSSGFMVLDLGSFQVAWPSSETDINCRDQSGLAFEEAFQILLCKPAEKCGVPFMFLFHLSFERAKRGSSCDRGLLMLAANSFQINFYIFVTGI